MRKLQPLSRPGAQLWLFFLCITIFFISLAAPVDHADSDPWGTLLVSQALLEYGTLSLNAYPEAANLTYRLMLQDGRLYHSYPLGTSLLALPAVWLANRSGLDMAVPTHDFFLQDLLAALTVAGACALFYALAAAYLRRREALLLALVFTLGTSVASTMGAALWSFNANLLLTLSALLILVRSGPDGPTRSVAALIGMLIVAAYITRPTALAAGIAIASYFVALRRRQALLGFALGVMVALIGFGLFAWQQYGVLIPPYYQGEAGEGFAPRPLAVLIAFYGHFFSPGRGLLSFTPFLLLPLMMLFQPQIWRQPLLWLALIWFGIHTAAMLSWTHWWGGASFGPRLFTDALPALFLLTVLTWRAATELRPSVQRAVGSLFGLLAAVSIAIHTSQGLYQPATQLWHFVGFHTIEALPAALFDWRYPQFLNTPARQDERNAVYRRDPPVANTLWGQPIFGVAYLRTDPEWTPPHVGYTPDLAMRFNGALNVYEERWDVRLLFDREQFWVVSDRTQPATLRVEVRPIGRSWPLLLTVNDDEPVLIPTDTHQHLTLYLNLRHGANRIHLELLGCQPLAQAPNGDTRLIVGLRDLSLISHPLRAP